MSSTLLARICNALRVARAELGGRPRAAALPPGLLEIMQESVITFGLDLRVVSWSAGARRLYGWSAEEACGRPVFDLIGSGMSSAEQEAFVSRLLLEERWRETERRTRKDGSPLVASVTYTLLRDEAGAAAGILGVARDVTEAAAARARELDQLRLHGLEQRMNEAEIVVRVDGSIVHANDRALAMYGYDRPAMLALNLRELRAEGTHGEVSAQMNAALQGGIRFETEHRRADGSTLPVEVSSRGFEVGGTSYLHSLVRDLTDARALRRSQRELQQQLVENQQLVADLRDALQNVKTLSGLLPICMVCKKIRNDEGYWDRIERYLSTHTDALFSHGICPECFGDRFPGDG